MTTLVVAGVKPAVVVSSPATTIVTVPPAPQHVSVEQGTTVSVTRPTTSVAVDTATREVVVAGAQGPRGPIGPKGDPGYVGSTTDQLAEGATNLYFTPERAALAAPVQSVNALTGAVVLDAEDVGADPVGAAVAAASSAMATHLADPDPHGQYVADGDVLNGGNF